jgi:hypothetical protein
MKPCTVSIVLTLAAVHTISFGQGYVPAFSGTWKLDLPLSKVETKHPPMASTAKISYDGKVWHFSRTHHFPDGKTDTWSTTMIVDAKKAPHSTVPTHHFDLPFNSRRKCDGSQ